MGDVEKQKKSAMSKIGRLLGVSNQNLAQEKDQNSVSPPPSSASRKPKSSPSVKSGPASPAESPSLSGIPSTTNVPALVQTKPSRQSSLRQAGGILSSVSPSERAEPPTSVSVTPSASLRKGAYPPRFVALEDGTHEHHLRSAKRQEKLGHMIKDLMGAKKLRSEAISAVPNLLSSFVPPDQKDGGEAKPPTLFSGLLTQVKNNEISQFTSSGVYKDAGASPFDCRSFMEKYGRCQEVVGRGAFGVVRVAHKRSAGEDVLYAVKEFKRRPEENEKKYSRRLTSEFCISSSLKHPNIIDTLDLLQDAKGDYCEVMEFCSGGDLYTLIIAAGYLEYAEADCYFKQLVRGVNYMHVMGIAHRDLKPENLLLTSSGNLKITDFGNGECFRMAWEKEINLSGGICGSSPYIAPEEYVSSEFDPRPLDIWSCGVIYMAMRTGRQLWKVAKSEDEFYSTYLQKRKDAEGYEPIEGLKRARCRNVIYSILDPMPSRRITGKQVLNSEWCREIKVCGAGAKGKI